MDKLDKQWLVFEAFGVNFPWKDVVLLSDEDLEYIHKKADEAKKRHEAQLAQQQQMQEAQQQAQMQQMQQVQQAQRLGGNNPNQSESQKPEEAYAFNKP